LPFHDTTKFGCKPKLHASLCFRYVQLVAALFSEQNLETQRKPFKGVKGSTREKNKYKIMNRKTKFIKTYNHVT